MNAPPRTNMNAPKMNSPKMNVTSFTASASSSSESILTTLSSFLTSWYGIVFVIVVVMVLIAVYYQTVGYSLNLGWDKLKWSHDRNEKITIDVPGTPIAAELKPVGSKEGHSPVTVESAVNALESDVEKALGMDSDNGKQVFNVARNLYKFEDAEPLCRAFGAELATYDQVKNAYKAGADWCNYGWSKGQLALFPTQKETYEKLQQGPESQRMSCGLPGVNGGFFPNGEQRFGVNCYGARPAQSALDQRLQEADNSDIAFDREVNHFKSELESIPVNPWAKGQWSN